MEQNSNSKTIYIKSKIKTAEEYIYFLLLLHKSFIFRRLVFAGSKQKPSTYLYRVVIQPTIAERI